MYYTFHSIDPLPLRQIKLNIFSQASLLLLPNYAANEGVMYICILAHTSASLRHKTHATINAMQCNVAPLGHRI